MFGLFRKKPAVAKELRHGRGFTFDVVGEASFQSALASIVGGKTRAGHNHKCRATLLLDDKNSHDRNAVRVEIGGKTVAYLSREDALIYRERISAVAAKCDAKINGGWDYGDGDNGSFGVKLNVRWPPELEA